MQYRKGSLCNGQIQAQVRKSPQSHVSPHQLTWAQEGKPDALSSALHGLSHGKRALKKRFFRNVSFNWFTRRAIHAAKERQGRACAITPRGSQVIRFTTRDVALHLFVLRTSRAGIMHVGGDGMVHLCIRRHSVASYLQTLFPSWYDSLYLQLFANLSSSFSSEPRGKMDYIKECKRLFLFPPVLEPDQIWMATERKATCGLSFMKHASPITDVYVIRRYKGNMNNYFV